MIRDTIDLACYFWHKIYSPKAKVSFGAYVCRNSKLGDNARVKRGAEVYNSELGPDVTVAENCIISNSKLEHYNKIYPDCRLSGVSMEDFSYIAASSALDHIKIGRFCSIGPGFQGGTGNHPTNFVSTSPVFFSTLKQCGISFATKELFKETVEITICNDIWIGANVFIKDGVKIGNGAIVAAGAVVVNDVPDYAIVGGVPAKLIRYRFSEDIIDSLLKIQWWNWSLEQLQKAQPLMATSDLSPFIEWAVREFST